MLCALIMAGGKGTRFWPLSTEDRPKQFLNILGKETMIQMTVNRINKLIPMERIFVCTGEKYVDLVKEQLPELLERNIIVEPEGRNTAPCIALSAFFIKRYFKDATMVVLPSDHLIENQDKFINILKAGNEFLYNNNNAILTLGMTPTRPETGYGYIKYSNNKIQYGKNKVVKVKKFVEKPNYEVAKKYLEDGCYLWNSGMFMWKVESILEKIKNYLPNTYEMLHDLRFIREEDFKKYINENYCKTDAISIDYAVLEKDDDIYVIPSDIGWDDVGNWTSVERYSKKDANGNVAKNNASLFKSSNNIVLNQKKILLNNVQDLIVVETEDYILISSKEYEQEIKDAKEFCIKKGKFKLNMKNERHLTK